jgi:hypothetical protein
MKLTYIFAALVLLIGLSSCEKDAIRGEGQVVTEVRTTPDFIAIDMGGASKVHISYGTAFSVEVKGYANLAPLYTTRVSNNKLILGFKNNYNIRNDNTEVFITMPDLKDLHLSGSGDSDISGNFPHNTSLSLSISGSADIDMKGGSTDDLDIQISGSGNINVFPLTAKNADISISGSGKVRTQVINHLGVSISGSGRVYYKGSPQIQSKISGSGEVIKQN